MHSHMTAGNSPSMCSHFGIVHHVRDTGFWGVSEGAGIDSFQQISENTRQKGEFSSFWQSFMPPTQMSIQTKDFPPPQISSDTEFVLSDNTHCHSNKQWWPKHRIMWLHSESSRILTRILISNTFHFCGTSLQRISESFTYSIPNLQLEKQRKEERPILRSRQEAGLRVLRREEGEEWPRPGKRRRRVTNIKSSGLQEAHGAVTVLLSPIQESCSLWDNMSTWMIPIPSLCSLILDKYRGSSGVKNSIYRSKCLLLACDGPALPLPIYPQAAEPIVTRPKGMEVSFIQSDLC